MPDNALASDIITYVGVPLAVLGVLPILYNTLVTLAALSRIRRILRSARLTALTRSDIVNRIIEVDLPRYAVTPHHRSYPPASRSAYWSLSPHPSAVPGGSWTVFNWRATAVGVRTQRIEYSDQLRQPQCEVHFEDLLCYLLDLGAVPDPRGWRLLRNAGLWSPVGCCLMRSPEGSGKALTIAPLEESDGHLSLAVTWASEWTTRDHTSLPPYWVRLPATGAEIVGSGEKARQQEAVMDLRATAGSVKSTGGGDMNAAAEPDAIVCKISESGLVTAHHESVGVAGTEGPSDVASVSPRLGIDTEGTHEEDLPPPYADVLPINHLASYPGVTSGTWFASAATAYGTTPGTVLWNYRIPEPVLAFSRKESLPCGVLELLGLVDSSAMPEWRSKASSEDQHARNVELLTRRLRAQRLEMEKESRMKPEDRQRAVRERMQRESMQRLEDHRDTLHAHTAAMEAQRLDAIHSSKWSPAQFAPHALTWLQQNEKTSHLFPLSGSPSSAEQNGSGPASMPTMTASSLVADPVASSIKPFLGPLLHGFVVNPALASAVTSALDKWKLWSDKGGMRREDMETLMSRDHGAGEEQIESNTGEYGISPAAALAMASLVAAVIGFVGDGQGTGGMGAPMEASLSADLRECLKMWPKVRLG